MDENEIFNKEYNNLEFAKYVIDNYFNQLLSMFRLDHAEIKYLYKLIVLYPPTLQNYYYLLFQLLEHYTTSSQKYSIKFLKHIQIIYPSTFNINFYLDNPFDYVEHELPLMSRPNDQTLLNLLIKHTDTEPNETRNYILSIPGVDIFQVFNCVLGIDNLEYNSVYNWLDTLFVNETFNNCSISLICEATVNWMGKVKNKLNEDYQYYIEDARKYAERIIAYLRSKIKDNETNNTTMDDTIFALHYWMQQQL
eukprot:508664_1